MEDDSAIRKAGITKLNGSSNYRTQAAIIQAVIEAKDAWEAIVPSAPEAETSVEATDVGTAKPKGVTDRKLSSTERVRDTKVRVVILGYYGLEVLTRILYLQTAKEQQETLAKAYLPLGRQ